MSCKTNFDKSLQQTNSSSPPNSPKKQLKMDLEERSEAVFMQAVPSSPKMNSAQPLKQKLEEEELNIEALDAQLDAQLAQIKLSLEKFERSRSRAPVPITPPSPNMPSYTPYPAATSFNMPYSPPPFMPPYPMLPSFNMPSSGPSYTSYSLNERLAKSKLELEELRRQTSSLEEQIAQTDQELEQLRKQNAHLSHYGDEEEWDLSDEGMKQLAKQRESRTKLNRLARVYSLILDAYSDLHRQIRSSTSENQLVAMHDDIHHFLNEKGEQLDNLTKEQFVQFASKMILADHYWLNAKNSTEKTAEEIHNQITSLGQNESLILKGVANEHTFLYRIKKEGEGYAFTIINTGDDEDIIPQSGYRNYSKNWAINRPFDQHKLFRYSDKAYRCSLDALNPEFLAAILPSNAKTLEMPELIKKISHSMKSFNGRTVHGRPHHKQGRPSCSFKCVTSCLKGELIDQLGQEKGNALYAQFKVFRTQKIIDELAQFESEVGPAFLQEAYGVSSHEELQQKLQERDDAIQTVYQKRLGKAEASKNVIFA